MNDDSKPILARPTRNLPGGLRPGFKYWVDPVSEYVQERIRHGHLIVVQDRHNTKTNQARGVEMHEHEPKFGQHVEYSGDSGEHQFGHVTKVLANGNVNILYKQDGGGLEEANDVPYRGADDRKRDGAGHTYHLHGD